MMQYVLTSSIRLEEKQMDQCQDCCVAIGRTLATKRSTDVKGIWAQATKQVHIKRNQQCACHRSHQANMHLLLSSLLPSMSYSALLTQLSLPAGLSLPNTLAPFHTTTCGSNSLGGSPTNISFP